MTRVGFALADGVTVARRNLVKIPRSPEVLVAVLVSPLIFVVLFAYVFGSSIDVDGASYREFLIGGAFAMTLTFGSVLTGAALADDMQKGIIDRFRTLPMSRSAVVVGRTTSDLAYHGLTLAVMALAGLAVGWRAHNGLGHALVGFGLLVLFAYAFSWIMAFVGLVVPSPEVVNNASTIVILPLTFIANTFVPSDDLPTALRVFAEWNPVSAVTRAAREQFGNIPVGAPDPTAWPQQHATLYTLVWVTVIIAVFAPLTVARFNRTGASR